MNLLVESAGVYVLYYGTESNPPYIALATVSQVGCFRRTTNARFLWKANTGARGLGRHPPDARRPPPGRRRVRACSPQVRPGRASGDCNIKGTGAATANGSAACPACSTATGRGRGSSSARRPRPGRAATDVLTVSAPPLREGRSEIRSRRERPVCPPPCRRCILQAYRRPDRTRRARTSQRSRTQIGPAPSESLIRMLMKPTQSPRTAG